MEAFFAPLPGVFQTLVLDNVSIMVVFVVEPKICFNSNAVLSNMCII